MIQRIFTLLLASMYLTACASMSGMQQRFAVCSYDHAWEAALEAVKDRAIVTQDKDAGLIVTNWLEIPMPGRTFGALQREVGDSKDPASPSSSSDLTMSSRSALPKSGNAGPFAVAHASSAGPPPIRLLRL